MPTTKSGRKKKTKKPGPPEGRLGVLIPGMGGAVSTKRIAGILDVKRDVGKEIDTRTQIGHIRLGKRTEKNSPLIKDFIPLADLNDIEFAGWDIFSENCYDAAIKAGVLDKDLLNELRESLSELKPMPAVFSRKYVKNLDGRHLKKGKTKMDLARQLIEDIKNFKKEKDLDRLVMVWCGSTEVYIQASEVHATVKSFEEGLKNNHPGIPPSMIYAYAAIKAGVPYANGAPNL